MDVSTRTAVTAGPLGGQPPAPVLRHPGLAGRGVDTGGPLPPKPAGPRAPSPARPLLPRGEERPEVATREGWNGGHTLWASLSALRPPPQEWRPGSGSRPLPFGVVSAGRAGGAQMRLRPPCGACLPSGQGTGHWSQAAAGSGGRGWAAGRTHRPVSLPPAPWRLAPWSELLHLTRARTAPTGTLQCQAPPCPVLGTRPPRALGPWGRWPLSRPCPAASQAAPGSLLAHAGARRWCGRTSRAAGSESRGPRHRLLPTGPEGRLTFPATGQQLREHEQSPQCARHKQPFLPGQAGTHGAQPGFP